MKAWLQLNLDFDFPVLAVTITSTILLLVDYYFRLTPVPEVDRVVLYFVLPLLLILIGFRRKPSRYGFTLGDWRAGMLITLVAIVILAPVIWFVVSVSPGLQDFYQSSAFSFLFLVLMTVELFAWEFFFRGFIFFGYQEKFGDHALWLQAVPFAMAHVTKPAAETMTTLFGGFLFALVARRTKSFIYPFLIHWFVALFTRFTALSMV